MKIQPFESLACPLDGQPLHREGQSWRCAEGHCFDIASQGYVNLLPVQNKRSRDPGDSKEMVAARRRFLEAGFYHPIAARVAQNLFADRAPGKVQTCLDAGCGEGYYLREIASALPEGQALALIGLDISKWAVQSAARREKCSSWVVGSNAHLPLPDSALDSLLCMFGFPVYSEFARVLKPGGHLIQVDAGPDHLRELREIIYPRLKPEREAERACPAGFSEPEYDSLNYRIELSSQAQIADLLTMTPHLYRASAEGLARARQLTRLALTVDVRLTRWQHQVSD